MTSWGPSIHRTPFSQRRNETLDTQNMEEPDKTQRERLALSNFPRMKCTQEEAETESRWWWLGLREGNGVTDNGLGASFLDDENVPHLGRDHGCKHCGCMRYLM
jgi:hypothetical protein